MLIIILKCKMPCTLITNCFSGVCWPLVYGFQCIFFILCFVLFSCVLCQPQCQTFLLVEFPNVFRLTLWKFVACQANWKYLSMKFLKLKFLACIVFSSNFFTHYPKEMWEIATEGRLYCKLSLKIFLVLSGFHVTF